MLITTRQYAKGVRTNHPYGALPSAHGNMGVQFELRLKYAGKQLDQANAAVWRWPNNRLGCTADIVFPSMTEALRAAVNRYLDGAATPAQYQLVLLPNDSIKCRAEYVEATKTAFAEYAKYVMQVAKDLDALAVQIANT